MSEGEGEVKSTEEPPEAVVESVSEAVETEEASANGMNTVDTPGANVESMAEAAVPSAAETPTEQKTVTPGRKGQGQGQRGTTQRKAPGTNAARKRKKKG